MPKQSAKVSRREQRRQVERGPRECLFCGKVGGLTEEHVFGDWLQKIGYTGPGLRELIEDADPENRVLQPGHPFNKKLRIVCEDCNGVWMSGMETAAKSLLIDMFKSSGKVRLDENDQLVLARWAFKTVAVLTQLGTTKTFPFALCREFRATDHPSAYSQIWIGSAAVNETPLGQQLAESSYVPRMADLTFSRPSSESAAHSTRRRREQTVRVFCYSARFRLINVVFDIFGHVPTNGLGVHADLSPDLRRALLPIWPSEQSTIWWPPVVSLDTIGGVQGLSSVPLVGIPTILPRQ